LSIWFSDSREIEREGIFPGLWDGLDHKYPSLRYCEDKEPLLVNNTEEDEAAKALGYDTMTAGMMSNKQLINFFWDLEDMSPKQLCVYAWEEYGVELPIDAGQEKLLKAVLYLGKIAPQNEGNIVFMAHTIQMNYDETINEIRRMNKMENSEVEVKEFFL
jgi:hypothetical protein